MNEQVIDSTVIGQPPIVTSAEKPPWGPWVSLGWSAAICAITIVIQLMVGIAFLFSTSANRQHGNVMEMVPGLVTNGLYISVATCCTTLICTPIILGLARLRGPQVRQYLALNRVKMPVIIACLVIIVVFNAGSDGISLLFHRHIVPDFVKEAYATAGFYPLMWLAFVIAAPIFEELLFRGFLFRGLAAAKTGTPGAILFTSLMWAVLHIQYDFIGIATVFITGLIFGVTRARTNSIYPTLAMHIATNFGATLEAALQHKFGFN